MNNWKTIAIGILGGIFLGLNRTFDLHVDESHINYITLFLLSLVSKDYDTTGAGSDARKESK